MWIRIRCMHRGGGELQRALDSLEQQAPTTAAEAACVGYSRVQVPKCIATVSYMMSVARVLRFSCNLPSEVYGQIALCYTSLPQPEVPVSDSCGDRLSRSALTDL